MSDLLKMMHLESVAESDLPDVAEELVKQSNGLNIWLLSGEMGAGKTTLVRYIVEQIGIHAMVSSPTFSIVNQYGQEPGKVVYHFDLYRLKNEMEAFDIGMEEYLNSGNLCLIEWPDKLQQLLPEKYFEVRIATINQQKRTIDYCRHD